MERRISPQDYADETGTPLRTVYQWLAKGWLPKGALRVEDERHPDAQRPAWVIVMPNGGESSRA